MLRFCDKSGENCFFGFFGFFGFFNIIFCFSKLRKCEGESTRS